ncbi:alanine racemase [Chitinimonas lacunae]|uniref:Alanine racemase n=1 Tax=Chitinimonas lacunae TaxID=1963018 RepID=A0ABV8ML69_9NEIS
MSRPLTATIRLDHLRANYQLARRLHGGRVLATVKANAYGHGAVAVARALADQTDGFAVACIEEALTLREAGITQPILLLEGWFEPAELELIVQHQLWTALHCPEQLAQLEQAKLAAPLPSVWLKFDSGMHRLGLPLGQAHEIHRRVCASGKVESVVLATHFARADELDCPSTTEQIERFRAAVAGLPCPLSLANSGGVLGWQAARGDWARPGIMLYGGASLDRMPAEPPLPVMQLDSKLIAVQSLSAGEAVGYGARFVTERASRIGLVACGYADGYPRAAKTGTPVLIDGRRSRVVGRVSMDMLAVDLEHFPEAGVGTPVRLWGEGLPADEVAQAAGTISYELFCNVKRAHFRYVG